LVIDDRRFIVLKNLLKDLAQKAGVYVASTERFGIDVELDLIRLTATNPLKTIFDVGANFGQTAQRFSGQFPNAAIFSFEPVSTSFVRLQETVKPLAKVKAFNIGIGDEPGSATINLHLNAGSNSLRPAPGAKGTEEITIDTLDHFSASHGTDTIDLLKIDVEGFELPVLRGASILLSQGRIRYVYTECEFSPNPDTPHTSFFDLHATLSKAGFCFINYYAESFSLIHGSAMGNVLYALRSELPVTVPGNVRNIA